MSADYAKPLPVPTKEDAPFWSALRDGRFVLPSCTDCGHVWFPPYLNCPSCLSLKRTWIDAQGTGVIDGVTIIDKPYLPSFAADLPYNVVLVRLAEGPRMYSNVVGTPSEDIRVGMRVRIVIDPVTPQIALPKFACVPD